MTETTPANRVVEDGRTLLAAQGDPQTLQRLIPASIRLLAEGRPVSTAQVADASGMPKDQAEAALRGVKDIEWTADGQLEGFGLTHRPTQHRIRIDEVQLYTWCAMDTLIFAAFLDRRVHIESPDGATGEMLRVETDGRRVIAADPASVVVTWFVDPAGTGFHEATCQFGHFFASPEGAAAWAAAYPEGGVLALEEAIHAARALMFDMFGSAVEAGPPR